MNYTEGKGKKRKEEKRWGDVEFIPIIVKV